MRVGDQVVIGPNINKDWNPNGKLTIINIQIGKRSGYEYITVVDESGNRFHGGDNCFKLIGSRV
ncbi:hypothetical protein CW311_04265 [Acinetobacter proteolyticus]|uniref:Uncharacterized protein n=1 Tax=Acinetobacter proteolyticus TaxID=1776741 RepID=A0A2N0WI82_9GAMM|nr:hypothetical protein CW311_04265 [Acinetobacter proteolyticus]